MGEGDLYSGSLCKRNQSMPLNYKALGSFIIFHFFVRLLHFITCALAYEIESNLNHLYLLLGQVRIEYRTRSMKSDQKFDSPDIWEKYEESIPNFDKTSWRENTLLEQMSATKDTSDYLWYTFR